jgi:hypothetical protein
VPPRDFPTFPPAGAPPPRDGSDGQKKGAGYWDKVDQLFYQTIRQAESAFRINLAINIVIVAVGVGLVASSILYTWVKGVDVLSTGIAGLGVADFVLIFFVGPQRYIEEGVRNLTRIQVVYRAYLLELESVADYDWVQFNRGGRTLADVQATVAEWERIASKSILQLDDGPKMLKSD